MLPYSSQDVKSLINKMWALIVGVTDVDTGFETNVSWLTLFSAAAAGPSGRMPESCSHIAGVITATKESKDEQPKHLPCVNGLFAMLIV